MPVGFSMSNDPTQFANLNPLEVWLAQADCLVSDAQMQQAYDRVAREITEQLVEARPLVLVVMTGGLIAAGQLLARLSFPLEVDYVHATRYRGTQGGDIEWRARPTRDLSGRTVLIVDDLLDKGITLAAVRDWCHSVGAARVLLAVAAIKNLPACNARPTPDFVGVSIPDRFVFGEGLDYDGYYRNVRGIFAVKTTP